LNFSKLKVSFLFCNCIQSFIIYGFHLNFFSFCFHHLYFNETCKKKMYELLLYFSFFNCKQSEKKLSYLKVILLETNYKNTQNFTLEVSGKVKIVIKVLWLMNDFFKIINKIVDFLFCLFSAYSNSCFSDNIDSF
jgi:hypothetical protein